MTQVLIVGIIIALLVLGSMLLSHSHSLQRFAVMEMLLVLTISLAVFGGMTQAGAFMKEQYVSLFGVYMGEAQAYALDMEKGVIDESKEAWKNVGDDYEAILERSLPVTTVDDDSFCYLTAAIYERGAGNSYYQKVFRQTKEDWTAENKYMKYVEGLANDAISLGGMMYEETGAGSVVLVYVGKGEIAPRYVLLTEVSMEPVRIALEEMQKKTVGYGAIFLLAGTLFIIAVVWLQGRQFSKLVKNVVNVAEGKSDWEVLQSDVEGFGVESNEMRKLKNSLSQIAADVTRLNYKKYKILQGYYRFSPKQIEKIFGKQSILDVEANDRIHTSGTLAFVVCPEPQNLGKQEYLNKMSRDYELLEKKQDEYGGISLSNSSDLSTMQILFQEETEKALQFGIDVAMQQEEGSKERKFVLLHRTAFVYGVAGSADRAFTYVISREMKALEKYVERFRSVGIRMVVTDSVYEMIEKQTKGRYIGYLENEECTFKLYEILDACPAKERQRRLDAKNKFEKALTFFYQGDYYLGRNLFTEVLKDCPDDEVAKWYLFLCEKCLNTEHGGDISYALFSE